MEVHSLVYQSKKTALLPVRRCVGMTQHLEAVLSSMLLIFRRFVRSSQRAQRR